MPAASAKTILILGGGVMQIPAVRLAKEQGWRVIVAARDVDARISAMADHEERVDLQDREAILDVARSYRRRTGLDGVFTAGTDFSITVAWVAARCGLPGIPQKVAEAASDKEKMRTCFHRHGVPCPRFFTVAADRPVPRQRLPYPLVVKPVDNMGARGVRRVDSEAQLTRALEDALEQSRTRRAIVEEYLDGPELSLDAIVFRGEITICGVADRHICFPPYFVEMGHTMPTCMDPELRQQVEQAFRQGIRALGITNGAAKGDIKLTDRGCAVGEIAARLSGGYMSGWTFPYATGLEVTRAALKIAVGLPPGDLAHAYDHVSAERAFISVPGIVGRIEGLDRARGVPGLEALFLRAEPGGQVRFPSDNMGKCGNVISRAPTRAEAIRAAEEAAQAVLVRLRPDQPQTTAYLLKRSRSETAPPALVLSEPANRRALEDLPALVASEGGGSAQAGIFVLDLPRREREHGRDWHGLPFGRALQQALEVTGFRLQRTGRPQGLVLGSLFWRAFLNGSVQGAVYLADTLAGGSDPAAVARRLQA